MLTNRQLTVPYIAPYFAYVAIASVPADIVSREINYGLRLVVVGALLFWARRWYCPLTRPGAIPGSVLWGIGAGVVGTGLWVVLLAPFVSAGAAPAWSGLPFALRFVAAGVLVPVFEEMMMRGYVFRLALQWDQERRKGADSALHAALDDRSLLEVRPGEWSWAAVALSSLVFTAGHNITEWPAAIAYGLLMCLLWIRRKDLLTCIVAHATTNVTLAVFVQATGHWQYW